MTCIAISEMRIILLGYLVKKDFKRLDMKSVCLIPFQSLNTVHFKNFVKVTENYDLTRLLLVFQRLVLHTCVIQLFIYVIFVISYLK